MKLMFVKKTGLWLAMLSFGVILVAVGFFRLAVGSYGSKDGGERPNPAVKTQQIKELQGGQRAEAIDPGQGLPATEKQNGTGEQKDGQYSRIVTQNGFFVEYRLERDRVRSQQIDLYREIVNNQNSPDETRKEAQQRLLGISQAIDTEMKLENLIKAENYKDVVVCVQEKSATVIVQSPLMTQPDKDRLIQIAVRVTGLSAESVVVIAKA